MLTSSDMGRGWYIPLERLSFLRALDELHPEVKHALFTRCGLLLHLEEFQLTPMALIQLLKDHASATADATAYTGRKRNGSRSGSTWHSDWSVLLANLREWQERYSLTELWLWEAAVLTLSYGSDWVIHPLCTDHFPYHGIFGYSFDLAVETDDAILRRVTTSLTHQLNLSIQEGRDTLQDIACVTPDLRHAWTVRYLIHKEGLYDIVRSDRAKIKGLTMDDVHRGIQMTAERTGLSSLVSAQWRKRTRNGGA